MITIRNIRFKSIVLFEWQKNRCAFKKKIKSIKMFNFSLPFKRVRNFFLKYENVERGTELMKYP